MGFNSGFKGLSESLYRLSLTHIWLQVLIRYTLIKLRRKRWGFFFFAV